MPTEESLNGKKKSKRKWLILPTLLIAIFLILSLNVPSPSNIITSSTSSSSFTTPAFVSIFGFASTTGAGTHPKAIVFTSIKSRQRFTANVSEGRFSIQLPNLDTYNVTTEWVGNYSWQMGKNERGPLILASAPGSHAAQSYNIIDRTPNSVIVVDGSIVWQMNQAIPVTIKFIASNGQEFEAPVLNKTFAIKLPNIMNYEVWIKWKDAEGNSDWYYAHELEVNAGVNMVGQTVELDS